jgi:transposase
MGQKRTNKQYSKEYKEYKEAVALIRDQGYMVPEAAKSLGIANNILYLWKDKIAADLESKLLSTEEQEKLIRLRKENKNLRMEKESERLANTTWSCFSDYVKSTFHGSRCSMPSGFLGSSSSRCLM